MINVASGRDIIGEVIVAAIEGEDDIQTLADKKNEEFQELLDSEKQRMTIDLQYKPASVKLTIHPQHIGCGCIVGRGGIERRLHDKSKKMAGSKT